MRITIIHGQSHKGSTYNVASILANKVIGGIGGDIKEFFLPRDFDKFCTGCGLCFFKSESLCPHYDKLKIMTEELDKADLIILASPVYVSHVTGAMKSFLDHYGYRWMVHRPDKSMFKKQAVCISTATGSGTKSTNKDMADSLFFWGIPKIYKYGVNVASADYESVDENIKIKIEKDVTKLASKIAKNNGKVKSGIKTKGFFLLLRFFLKKFNNPADVEYWNKMGWDKKVRPWK